MILVIPFMGRNAPPINEVASLVASRFANNVPVSFVVARFFVIGHHIMGTQNRIFGLDPSPRM
jgi:hypothetical protein